MQVQSLAVVNYVTSQSPVKEYSTQFIIPAIQSSHSTGYDMHLVASRNKTLIKFDSTEKILDQDEILVHRFQERTSTLVTCSEPCNVIQFAKSYSHNDGMFAIDVIPSLLISSTTLYSQH